MGFPSFIQPEEECSVTKTKQKPSYWTVTIDWAYISTSLGMGSLPAALSNAAAQLVLVQSALQHVHDSTGGM